MKVLTLCVGERYSKKYNTVKKNIDLTVCTDCPSYWNGFKIIPYTNNPFSFYDKLLVSLKHCIDIKQNLLYVDVDSINVVEYDLFDFKSTKFLFYQLWPDFKYTKISNLPDSIKSIWNSESDIELVPNIHEVFMYIPYSESIKNLYNDLLYFKSTWEDFSNGASEGGAKRYNDRGIGCGEGIPLGYYLLKNNIEFDTCNFKSGGFLKNLL
jgi:hypothetical protein|tara:strand:- start:4728 stop:5357 length:630 start_codon:yes stop_codon:yes gene_type:complete